MLNGIIAHEPILGGILVVAIVMAASQVLARLTRGRLHPSAIAITLGLAVAYLGGLTAGGAQGLADVPGFAGIALLGSATLRDISIVATAFGARLEELARCGIAGVVALLLGVASSFLAGGLVAYASGYTDPVSITTIGAGAATYIVGPVTGATLQASSEVIALSVAAGLVKALAVMLVTPLVAPAIGLTTPRAAIVFGGLMGTTSGVAAGLAAHDERLVPYGAMSATFFTGLGCLLGPSLFYAVVRSALG